MNDDELLFNPRSPFCFSATMREQYHLLTFCAMVAGKSAMPAARKLTDLMRRSPELDYESIILSGNRVNEDQIDKSLRLARTGKYKLLTRYFDHMQSCPVFTNILYSASYRFILLSVPGIGLKSASMFLAYTNPSARVAILDVHILKFLASLGYSVPASSPQDHGTYAQVEHLFLLHADRLNVRPWVLDIFLWRRYNGGQGHDAMNLSEFYPFVHDLETDPSYAHIVRP